MPVFRLLLLMPWIPCWYGFLYKFAHVCVYLVSLFKLLSSSLLSQILGNHTEFQRVAALLQDNVNFDIDVNASVFETNIRGEDPAHHMFDLSYQLMICMQH